MTLNYKTDKLPPNFIFLGVMLMGVGTWRIIVLDWVGIPLLVLSIVLVFLKSGIIIDTEPKKLKKYIGLFFLKQGKWEDVSQVINLQIIRTRDKQRMSVLTISRTASTEVYHLNLILPDRTIELMKGNEKIIHDRTRKIASLLSATIIHNSDLL